MPRTLRKRAAPKRAPRSKDAPSEPAFDPIGSVKVEPLSKRDLILAHHAARQNRVQAGPWAYYVGIAASCLIVFTGWWLTLDTNIHARIDPNAPGIIATVQDEVARTKAEANFKLPTRTEAEQLVQDPRVIQLQKEWAAMQASTTTKE